MIGVPVAAGIIVQATPGLAQGSTGLAAMILHSPLILSALLAIVLNAIMRIGIAQTGQIEVVRPPDARHDQVTEALDTWGEAWGLPRATVTRAADAVNQVIETVQDLSNSPVTLEARHDDIHVDLCIIYQGPPLTVPDRAPTPDELLNSPAGEASMAGWLIRNLANHVTPFQRRDEQGLLLRFDA